MMSGGGSLPCATRACTPGIWGGMAADAARATRSSAWRERERVSQTAVVELRPAPPNMDTLAHLASR